MACKQYQYIPRRGVLQVVDTRWPRFIFEFNSDGAVIAVVPEMKWTSKETRAKLCSSVWSQYLISKKKEEAKALKAEAKTDYAQFFRLSKNRDNLDVTFENVPHVSYENAWSKEGTISGTGKLISSSYLTPNEIKAMCSIRITNSTFRNDVIYHSLEGHPYYAKLKLYTRTGKLYASKHGSMAGADGVWDFCLDVTGDTELTNLINNAEKGNEMSAVMQGTLFEVKETKKMGLYVATNRNGEYVLEMKDTGDYAAFAEDALEEVIPYSYGVKFVGGNSVQYNYFGKEGSVELGDFLMSEDGSIVVVTALDTKSRKANKAFNGRKLVTTEI